MPSGAASRELLGDAAVAVVERRVEAEVVAQVARPSPASRRCRSRGGRAAWRSGRRALPTAPAAPRDEDDVALAQRRDVEQADVGGQPGHAEHAEVGGRGRAASASTSRACVGRDHRVLAPAEAGAATRSPAREAARRGTRRPRRPRRRRAARRAGTAARRTAPVVHAPAHVRVDRHERVADDAARRRPGSATSTSARRKSSGAGSPPGGRRAGSHGSAAFAGPYERVTMVTRRTAVRF